MAGESGVESVVRALHILQAFSAGDRTLTLGQLSARVGLPKSSVHRLVSTLQREGFMARDSQTGRYGLGLSVLRLAGPALAAIDLRSIARPYLEWLARELKDTVHLGVLDHADVIYIDKIESPSRIQMISHIGGRVPPHCTGLGKAILAFLEPEQVEVVVRERGLPGFTSSTITSLDALSTELAAIRSRGYAVDEGEHEGMVRCIAAPIRDVRGHVAGAVSATTVVTAWEDEHRSAMTVAVVDVARAVSAMLGMPASDGGGPCVS